MVFVTVGTHTQPFDRLVREAERLAGVLEEEVVIQSGPVPPANGRARHVRLVSFEEAEALMRQARVVVGQAGVGTVLTAMKVGKPVILIPRRRRFGEHLNDHQVELARAVQDQPGVRVLFDIGDLEAAVRHPPAVPAREQGGRGALVAALRAFAEECARGEGEQKRLQREWYDTWRAPWSETVIARNNQVHRQRFVALLPRRSFARILELGCGHRVQLDELGEERVALDLSLGEVQRLAAAGSRGLVADAEQLPFRDESFDLVCGFGVLHHLAEIPAGLREAVRVTRRGGVVGFGAENSGWCPLNYVLPFLYGNWRVERGFRRVRARRLRRACEAAGLTRVRVAVAGAAIYGLGDGVYRVTAALERWCGAWPWLRPFLGFVYIVGEKV